MPIRTAGMRNRLLWKKLRPRSQRLPLPRAEGFSEDGNLVTRDLLYDAATNKQFITVETSGGNTFYIVIDYDKPVDEDGETVSHILFEHGG